MASRLRIGIDTGGTFTDVVAYDEETGELTVTYTGAEVRPFDEDGAAAVARWFRGRGVGTLGVCFLHSYANPAHERAMRVAAAPRLTSDARKLSAV